MSFTDNGDGTVTDTVTGLMWQKETSSLFTQSEAISYCDNLELAGHIDWRLPTITELLGIVDYTKHNPAIDSAFESKSWWYWSNSNCADDPNNFVWIVHFLGGLTRHGFKDNSFCVRAVRNA
jgi:hypothetical protein